MTSPSITPWQTHSPSATSTLLILTGTTPNRLYFWTGTIREKMSGEAKANVWNSDVDYGEEAHWKTYPEVLEENGVSWKIYQNEISVGVDLQGEAEAWLANFTDNPIEWFSQYHVHYHEPHLTYIRKLQESCPAALPTWKSSWLGSRQARRNTAALKGASKAPVPARNR